MKTHYPDLPEGNIAYIREVSVDSLPDAIRAKLDGAQPVYGIHTETGECVALARDRKLAFMLARQNDLNPVSAH
ncbi:MAG: putative small protein [Rhodobacteraceae bacterium HLUCCA12]|nr:MAG: putative small protein [Rhodobacteraceae bacterium HLUCCA12]